MFSNHSLARTCFVGLLTCVTVCAAAEMPTPAPARADAPRPVATVNGRAIPSEFAELIADADPKTRPPETQQIAERLVNNEVLVQEAQRLGLEKRHDIAVRTQLLHRDLLVNAYIQDYLRAHPIADAAVRDEYDKRSALLRGAKEYKVRHILLADEAGAREVARKLAAGGDFDALAEERSLDEGSRGRGGSLGWVSVDNADRSLIDAVSVLSPGASFHSPVHTAAGWEVAKLEAVRDIRILPFDDVRERLRAHLQQQQAEQLEQELRQKATVVWPNEKATAALDAATKR